MNGASDGMKIIIGLLPVFVVAAFFEGFITRHTEMPVWLSSFILLSSLTFVIFYFVLYPRWLVEKIAAGADNASTLPYDPPGNELKWVSASNKEHDEVW